MSAVTDYGPHTLVVDGEDDWHIDHPPTCTPVLRCDHGGCDLEHPCPFAALVDESGPDAFDTNPDTLPPGTYPVAYWEEQYGSRADWIVEWDAGLTITLP
ncbi:hypothetical protein [Blastococcus mobilis]|uniref:Uncharacterized protein n=1 Tax=Blastococcus mobilis TaxID=1938746 RepID=A0A238VXM7_9ACTN|nr:hypothetical protein [Blastococcus mobilis]SNR38603.1 hypothetical protein SAMN06272737_105103 [Blastococcus mobilis]